MDADRGSAWRFWTSLPAATKIMATLGTIAGTLAAAADLTVDLPEAAPRWHAWLLRATQFLPPAAFFYGFFTACMCLLVVTRLLAWKKKRRRLAAIESPKGEMPPAPTPAEIQAPAETGESLSSPESVGRFREMYSCCKRTFQYAYELLIEICVHETDSQDKNYIKRLIQAHVLPTRNKSKEKLDILLTETRPLTHEEFAKRIALFERALGDYIELISEIKRAAPRLLGEEVFAGSKEDREILERHAKCLEELRKARSWPDLTHLADHHLSILENLLPNPSHDRQRARRIDY